MNLVAQNDSSNQKSKYVARRIYINIYTLGASHFTWLWLPKVSCCIATAIFRQHVFDLHSQRQDLNMLTHSMNLVAQNDSSNQKSKYVARRIYINIYTLGASQFTWLWLPKVSCCIATAIVRQHVFAFTEARLKYVNAHSYISLYAYMHNSPMIIHVLTYVSLKLQL